MGCKAGPLSRLKLLPRPYYERQFCIRSIKKAGWQFVFRIETQLRALPRDVHSKQACKAGVSNLPNLTNSQRGHLLAITSKFFQILVDLRFLDITQRELLIAVLSGQLAVADLFLTDTKPLD